MSEINISGLKELDALLRTLPDKLSRNIMRGALRAGAKEIMETAKSICPVGEPSSRGKNKYRLYSGALRDSIRLTVKLRGGIVSASVKAGGKSKKTGADVYYAHIIEYTGAAAHTITAKNRTNLSFGGLFFQSADHPGMTKKPFMRPAADARASAAVITVGNYIKNRLATKEGLDTSDIIIEEAE